MTFQPTHVCDCCLKPRIFVRCRITEKFTANMNFPVSCISFLQLLDDPQWVRKQVRIWLNWSKRPHVHFAERMANVGHCAGFGIGYILPSFFSMHCFFFILSYCIIMSRFCTLKHSDARRYCGNRKMIVFLWVHSDAMNGKHMSGSVKDWVSHRARFHSCGGSEMCNVKSGQGIFVDLLVFDDFGTIHSIRCYFYIVLGKNIA